MADEDLPPVHQDFSRWLMAIELENDRARTQARWKGVLDVVEEADSEMVEALVRLVFPTRHQAAAQSVEIMRNAFRLADETFEMQGNDRELEVLAGACLAVLMEQDGDAGAIAALSVATAAMGGARQSDVPMPLAILAEDAINRISSAVRLRPQLVETKPASKLDFDKAIAKIRETSNLEGVIQAFTVAATGTNSAIATLRRKQAGDMAKLEQFVKVQDEELQMLWWLMGQYSWDLNCEFTTVSPEVQPLVFAKELGEITAFLPGPRSIKALLSRAGVRADALISVPEIINAADSEWLQSAIAGHTPSPVVTPLHFTIVRQLETGAGPAWVAGWEASTRVGSDFSVPLLTVGTLFYRERLLLSFG